MRAEPSREPMIMKRSLVLSLTNPKAILFYVSFFVQFIDVNAKNTGTSFLILATTLELISFYVYELPDLLWCVCTRVI